MEERGHLPDVFQIDNLEALYDFEKELQDDKKRDMGNTKIYILLHKDQQIMWTVENRYMVECRLIMYPLFNQSNHIEKTVSFPSEPWSRKVHKEIIALPNTYSYPPLFWHCKIVVKYLFTIIECIELM